MGAGFFFGETMNHGVVNCALTFMWNDGNGYSVATCSNTYVVESDEPVGLQLYADMNQALADAFAGINECMGNPAFLWGCTYRPVAGSDIPEHFDEVGGEPGSYIDTAPFFMAIVVQKFTAASGNPRGKAYIPYIGGPLGQNALLANYDGPFFQGIADKFAVTAASGSTTMVPVVWKPGTATAEPITHCKISQWVAQQRRRAGSRRYYKFP
jgi:hypothetical protein